MRPSKAACSPGRDEDVCVGAVALTASASASAGTAGTAAGVSGNERHAVATGHYENGIAVFTIAKGGLMYEAAVAGQKFSFTPAH